MLFITIILFILCKAILSHNEQLPYNFYNRISAIALLFCSILSLNSLYYESLNTGIAIFGGFFHVNSITQIMESFLYIIGSIILVAWPIQHVSSKLSLGSSTPVENISLSIKENQLNITNYSILILFNCLGASLLISSYDFISMYLSIELQSFSLYILATLYKESELATSAGLKYFLLGGFSSCLILLGAGLVYSYTGLTDFESLYILISSFISPSLNTGIENFQFTLTDQASTFFIGLVIIFVGFLFKISAAPFHNWSPDVYDESPTIVTIWLTIIPKIAILMFLLELFSGCFSEIPNSFESQNLNETIKNVLLFSSLLSLIIGSVVGLVQKRVKRLLAYSTISHVGFILLSLAIHSEQSIDSFLFYIIQYTLTNLNIFLIIIAISYYRLTIVNNNLKDIRYLTELKNQFTFNPLIALSFSICLFSMAGIPPLMGFFSKQFVLYSAIESGHYFMSFVAIFVSVISAYYYLTIIKLLHLEEGLTQDKIIPMNANIDAENNKTFVSVSAYGLELDNKSNINNTELESTESILENNYSQTTEISSTHSFMISTLTLSILLFILKPSLILNGTQLLSLSLFNF